MIQPIHTAVPGRARYKVEGLYRSESLKRHLEARVSAIDNIQAVSASTLTGNILVHFDPARHADEIIALLDGVVAEHRKKTANDAAGSSHINLNESGGHVDRSWPQTTAVPPHRHALRPLVAQAEEQRDASWHEMDADAVAAQFETSTVHGLSQQRVEANYRKYGPNLLPEAVQRSGLSIFLDQFKSLPVALLGVAAGFSLVTGGVADAMVITAVVVINAAIGYGTESQAETIMHSLKHMVHPSASVIRDGTPTDIRAEDVVVGDLLVLSPGSYVSVDGRLVVTDRLSVDESTLTGESLPVAKTTAALQRTDAPLADRVNMVYKGTLVTSGQGRAVVVATGRFTEMGRIQSLVGEAEPPSTPMERQLSQLGRQLALTGSGVCALVFGIGILRGYGVVPMLKTAISLAVAAIPEGLPAVATTSLALGMQRMQRRHVLMRHLEAVETLGSVQTICLDKTGTLTLNRMSVASIYAGMRRISVTDGNFFSDTGGLDPLACDELLRLMHVVILCNETEVSRDGGQYVLKGSSTESALLHMAISAGVDVMELRAQYPLLQINHRAEQRNFMSSVHAMNSSSRLVALKGSPPEVLAMCQWYIKDGAQMPVTEEDRLAIETENEHMAGNALRVLGAAYTYVAHDDTDVDVQDGLTWLGLMGMADPVRQGVKEAIGTFHQAGIDTVMITGDQSLTAHAIAKELNLSRNGPLEILDSTQLAPIDPDVLQALSTRVHVFARVSPAHKLQIVQALQRAGKVVAMTGDGINDGPALKAADIGIAMGHTGTDVAHEVADVILEDDNLETMIIAVGEGRRIYDNIRKSIHYLLSTNLSEILVMFSATAAGLGQPLNAMQLLWINLVSDIAPALALALEPPEPDVLRRPPRRADEPIIQTAGLKRTAFESTVLSAGALGAYGYGIARYGMGSQAGTVAFTSLTMGQLLHAVSCRSETHRVLSAEPLPPNRYLDLALLGSLTVQVLALVVPGLRSLLGIAPIGLLDALVIGGSAVFPLVINEAYKSLGTPNVGGPQTSADERGTWAVQSTKQGVTRYE
jgi:Ca2+-transporting ATPase